MAPPENHDDGDLRRQLMAVAQDAAGARGWPWEEPVEIKMTRATPGERRWSVRTNISKRGRNVRIVIGEPGWQVLEAAFLPR